MVCFFCIDMLFKFCGGNGCNVCVLVYFFIAMHGLRYLFVLFARAFIGGSVLLCMLSLYCAVMYCKLTVLGVSCACLLLYFAGVLGCKRLALLSWHCWVRVSREVSWVGSGSLSLARVVAGYLSCCCSLGEGWVCVRPAGVLMHAVPLGLLPVDLRFRMEFRGGRCL